MDHSADDPARQTVPVAARPGEDRRLLALFLAFLVAAPLPWVFAHFLPPHNHDAAALLQFAERWLAGERLYVDLIDVNPPLIIVLSLVPALIGLHTAIAGTTALVLCMLAFVATCLLLAWRVLIPDGRITDSPLRLLLPPLCVYLAIVHPGIEFTQRENLLVAAALPYLLLAAVRAQGARLAGALSVRRSLPLDRSGVSLPLSMLIASIAALGFAIKPHFLIVPVLVELYVAWVRGFRASLRDPVPWTMLGLFVAYLGWVLAVMPHYLTEVVPLVTAQYVDLGIGSRGRLGVLFLSGLTPTLLLFLPLAVVAAFASRLHLARIAALAAVGAIAFAVVQGKGWDYQLVPAEAFVILLGAILAGEAVERGSEGLGPVARRHLVLGLLAGFMLAAYYLTGNERPLFPRKIHWEAGQGGQLLKRIEREAQGRPVMSLTPGLFPHFPVLNYAGSPQAMRFMNLWLLQSVYARCLRDGSRYRDPAAMPPAERLVFESVAADLRRHAPRLVVVDKNPGIPWCGSEFDFVEYFLRNPDFAEQWAGYVLVEEFDRYRLFVRR